MFAKKCLILSILLMSHLALGESSSPHPFSVQDMVAMERLSEPKVSPDGKWIVYVRKSWDSTLNKSTSNLWLVSSDGAVSRSLTSVKNKSDTAPVWSPDGRSIAFVSNRSDTQQIWLINLSGGEAHQLSDFAVNVSNLQWSPNGSHLAFSCEVYPDADMAETKKRDKQKEDSPLKATIFDSLMIRHWGDWFDGKRSHIFVVELKQTQNHNSGWMLAGNPVDLMKGVNADAPTKPFGGAEEFAWSPDSSEIAYTMQIGKDMAWSTDLNVYLVSIKGGAAKCITCDNKATDKVPAYSPDGKTIAYLAMERPGFEADRLQIKLYDRKTGTARSLTQEWDRSASSLLWTADSKSLIVTAEERARQKIFRVDALSGNVVELVGQHYNANITIAGSNLVFLQDSMMGPSEVSTANADGSQAKQLTQVNDARLQLALRSNVDEFEFVGAEGGKVQAWILKPVGFKEGKKYPLAFLIHGGPQGAWEDHFSYRWNPQAFAGAGYGVVMVNFHGSTGFGQAFTDSISQDWGGKPFEDLMKGLDYAISNYSWIDENKVAALGASYGGFMINWINGHTDRFKCLVNHDGVFDAIGMYYGTEELWFDEWEHGGVPWEKPEAYEKFSPSRFVDKWKTPTLVIHGGKDFRIPDVQGISTFTALQRRGIPSKFLYFPDENHWVLKQKNSVLWHETVLGWLAQWLK